MYLIQFPDAFQKGLLFFLGLRLCQLSFESDSLIAQLAVFHIDGSLVPTVKQFLVFGHMLVELVEIDIGKYGADDAALRSAAVTLMQLVIFHISCVEKFTDKAQKTLIFNSLAKDANHDIMIDIVEEAFNISFHKPLAPGKAILNHSQSRVTASIRSEAMGGVFKTVFIDGFQQHTDNFLYQLVVNGRDTQRTEFSVLFGNICPSGRLGLVGFVFQGSNEPVDSFKAHCIDGLSVCACGHVSLTGIDILICL